MGEWLTGMSEQTLTLPVEKTAPTLSGVWLHVARVSWAVLAVAALVIFVAALPGYAAKFGGQLGHATGTAQPPGARFFAAASGVASLASALLSISLSALLFRRKFGEPVAALLAVFLLLYGIIFAGPLEFAASHWLGSAQYGIMLQGLLIPAPVIALLLLFPNGRFIPSWARWLLLLLPPWNVALLWLIPFDADGFSRAPLLTGAVTVLFIIFVLVALYAQVYRYRRAATHNERQQIRWAAYGFALWMGYILLSTLPYLHLSALPPEAPTPWWGPASELGWWLSLSILPVCLTIAITRYRLWDVDVVINRTLVYGALTAIVLAVYGLLVGGMGVLFQTQGNWLVTLVVTGLVAVLFQPLRARLQRGVNRFMYGERDEPFEVLARLGQRLEGTISPETVYPTIVETVANALKLPYAAVFTRKNGEWQPAEASGEPTPDLITFPLIYQGETVGKLVVARRTPDEPFSPADERILRNIARQAGASIHAVQLMSDLQRSRRQLVTAREEERRRLRRDLHDGLGASLAGLHLQVGALRRAIGPDPAAAEAIADELRADIRATIDDIRRLVYDLRPPMLDQLGLAAAVRAQAAQCDRHGSTDPKAAANDYSLHVEVDAPEVFPPLPAAVEVAAYRIVQEALTNVVHHARARRCRVSLQLNGALEVEIVDDGVGVGAQPKDGDGLGLLSMRERAAELGGSCEIAPARGGGTRVFARLPLSQDVVSPMHVTGSG